MDAEKKLALTRYLISHLCHELVSPIGAINNGVELIEDFAGQGVEKDAFQLIAQSGKTAATRLRFYRLAYGNAGTATEFRLRDARAVAAELFESDRRLTLEWTDVPDADLMAGAVQVTLGLVMLASLCLPRGGAIEVATFTPAPTGGTIEGSGPEVGPPDDLGHGAGLNLVVRANGPSARILAPVAAAAQGEVDDLDHKTVHALYCSRLAQEIGQTITIASESDLITFSLTLPAERLAEAIAAI
jgi:histidine phosphotransferase ChpT